MINNKTVIGIIPARSGSKGLLRKNLKNLCGKPLIAWSIIEAEKSKYIDRYIISTDDVEIARVAKKYGCDVPFLRPVELATDDANINDVILHALDILQERYEIVIVLQPTSPLRTAQDIDEAIRLYLSKKSSKNDTLVDSVRILTDITSRDIEKSYNIENIQNTEAYYSNRYGWTLRKTIV